jgi:hypothetical protein
VLISHGGERLDVRMYVDPLRHYDGALHSHIKNRHVV